MLISYNSGNLYSNKKHWKQSLLDSYLRTNSIPSSIGLKTVEVKILDRRAPSESGYLSFEDIAFIMIKWYYIVVHPRVIVY